MNDQQNYERLEKLYAQLAPEGQAAMRDLYPECFKVKLPANLDEVAEGAGLQTTMQVNVPIYAAARLKSFAQLLNIEAALNNGAEGKIACSVNLGDGKPTAFHPVRRDMNPTYRLPIFLDQEKMDYALETFPEIFNKLICLEQS